MENSVNKRTMLDVESRLFDMVLATGAVNLRFHRKGFCPVIRANFPGDCHFYEFFFDSLEEVLLYRLVNSYKPYCYEEYPEN